MIKISLNLEDSSWDFCSCMDSCIEKLSINIRDGWVSYVITDNTNTPLLRTMYRRKPKAGLRCSPRGLHTRTRLSSLSKIKLDSSLKTILYHLVASQSSFLLTAAQAPTYCAINQFYGFKCLEMGRNHMTAAWVTFMPFYWQLCLTLFWLYFGHYL